MNKTYIGIDNGVTGSIGVVLENGYLFIPMFTKTELSYTKDKQTITRIDFERLFVFLESVLKENLNLICLIERPMVNPGRFKATSSALRSLEAVLICLEQLSIPFQYIDSKEWQKILLPNGLKKEELKKASIDIGCRLFPSYREHIIKHKDADGILIAEYAKRKNL